MVTTLPLIGPDWSHITGVGAACSQRLGGVSVAPWDSLNLGGAVGDELAHVALNRTRFTEAIGAQPVWLRQVHGRDVIRLRADASARAASTPTRTADAAWTTERGLACAVLVADCMPALFALDDGSAVAAAHAGWRGLAAGVLEATVQALCEGTGQPPERVQVWLGPCIGPTAFEVGADVLDAFAVDRCGAAARGFVPRPRADGSPRWLANLPWLATDRLQRAGVHRVSSAGRCTVNEPSRFFSFRRDGVTGRFAAAIWRR